MRCYGRFFTLPLTLCRKLIFKILLVTVISYVAWKTTSQLHSE